MDPKSVQRAAEHYKEQARLAVLSGQLTNLREYLLLMQRLGLRLPPVHGWVA